MAKVPYSKGRKLCIFCGAPADSEEHIWPLWAKDILPTSPYYRRFFATGRRSTGTMNVQRNYNRQGAITSVRIKRVCTTCNSTWMSGYESGFRFHLDRLFQAKRDFLTAASLATLAEYLTYKMLVLDWMEFDPVLPPEWAHEFYRSRAIPPNTYIYAFTCYEGDWRLRLFSEAVPLYHIDEFKPGLPRNTKSFAIGFGDLFVLAIFAQYDLDLQFDSPAAFRLWPPSNPLMIWPLRQPIDSEQAEFISHSLRRIGDTDNVIAM